jgi:allophanate hydrolase subunit 2
MDGPQTSLFDDHVLSTFYKTTFTRAPRGNRQGVQLDAKQRFTSSHASSLASDLIGPGDLQMTGDGLPYVLMAECQTMGGYPRIGTVIAADLPIIAQAAPGTLVRFQRLPVEKADALHWNVPCLLRAAATMCRDMIRDPRTIADLLSYQLISGVSRGDELEDVSLPVKGSTKAYPLRSGETIC